MPLQELDAELASFFPWWHALHVEGYSPSEFIDELRRQMKMYYMVSAQ